jgi:hypothetical protein
MPFRRTDIIDLLNTRPEKVDDYEALRSNEFVLIGGIFTGYYWICLVLCPSVNSLFFVSRSTFRLLITARTTNVTTAKTKKAGSPPYRNRKVA